MSTQTIRRLDHTKASAIIYKKGIPGDKEGANGDLQVRYVPKKGIFLFIKVQGKWFSRELFEGVKEAGLDSQPQTASTPAFDGKKYVPLDLSEIITAKFGSPGVATLTNMKVGAGAQYSNNILSLGDETDNIIGALCLSAGDGTYGPVVRGADADSSTFGTEGIRFYSGTASGNMITLNTGEIIPIKVFYVEKGALWLRERSGAPTAETGGGKMYVDSNDKHLYFIDEDSNKSDISKNSDTSFYYPTSPSSYNSSNLWGVPISNKVTIKGDSNDVMVSVQFGYMHTLSANRSLYFGLSQTTAPSGNTSWGDRYERLVWTPDETDRSTFTVSWVVLQTALDSGDNDFYLMWKSSAANAFRAFVGGSSADSYPPFIITAKKI